MSLWSQIKYAMNSTLGTSEFKPLDKIIVGQRTWGASDAIIKVTGRSVNHTTETTVGSFTPKVDGSVRVAADVVDNRGYNDCKGYLNVYNGDISVGSTSALSVPYRSVSMSVDIPVTANTKYTIKAYVDTPLGTSVKNVRVCGSLIDTSLME